MSVPLSTHAVAPDLGSWRAQAACQPGDHELFFPPEEERGEYFRLRVSLAKRICASCPVRRQCADYALAADERYGVWGGLTAEERARQLRRRAVA
jgi:WhiB family redox-sensing transcriptional regulator